MNEQQTLSPETIRPIRWEDGAIIVIDQTRLPLEYVERRLTTVEEVAEAIEQLVVRGAPLIGITAAYGVALAAHLDPSIESINAAIVRLKRTRPTARDLFAALDKIEQAVNDPRGVPIGTTAVDEIARRPLEEALSIHQRDLLASSVMATQAPDVFTRPGWVLTICNTGALATGGGGTALGVIIEGWKRGLVEGVYACETRPLLQGARLTCWELERLGVPFKLLPDSAAASLLAGGEATAVASGADRIARNGDVANKVGTRMLALLAGEAGVPFYVAAPRTTFDKATATGADIIIEQRNGGEVKQLGQSRVTPDSYEVYNPSFDVTEAAHITGYITAFGVFTPASLKDCRIWT